MADALCGPSSALQTFQKHTQVDRSLQQDRSAFRPRQHENFRTSPGPSNAHIDAEFEAFQSGQAASQPFGPVLHQQQQHQAPHFHPAGSFHHAPPPPPAAVAHSPLPAWATDFQQLNIHEARQSPIPAARFRHEAPLQRSSGASWHAEFLRHEKTATPPPTLQHSQQQQQYSSFAPSFGQQAFMGAGFGAMQGFAPGSQQQQHNHQAMQKVAQVDMFDDAAFAAAFDSAAALVAQPESKSKGKAKEREREREQVGRPAESQQEQFNMDSACVEAPEPFFADVADDSRLSEMSFRDGAMEMEMAKPFSPVTQEAPMHGLPEREQRAPVLDPVYDQHHLERELEEERMAVEEEERQQERERMDPALEADELSRTAGQLLDNLKHEQGEKFANSNFMALMRQLRDREVKVEGDNFVETTQALHPGGPTYPHDAFQHRPPRVAE